jgi:hypothetical protein
MFPNSCLEHANKSPITRAYKIMEWNKVLVSKQVMQRRLANKEVNDRVNSNTVFVVLQRAMDLLWSVQTEEISGNFSSYLILLQFLNNTSTQNNENMGSCCCKRWVINLCTVTRTVSVMTVTITYSMAQKSLVTSRSTCCLQSQVTYAPPCTSVSRKQVQDKNVSLMNCDRPQQNA